jgi:hypothetical protein
LTANFLVYITLDYYFCNRRIRAFPNRERRFREKKVLQRIEVVQSRLIPEGFVPVAATASDMAVGRQIGAHMGLIIPEVVET